jgi:hypothetical protein
MRVVIPLRRKLDSSRSNGAVGKYCATASTKLFAVGRDSNSVARWATILIFSRTGCVTGSVAVGTPRDGQDTTGRESRTPRDTSRSSRPIWRSVRTLRRNSRIRQIGQSVFQDRRDCDGVKDLRLWFPEFCFIRSGGHVLPRRRLPPTASREAVRPPGVSKPFATTHYFNASFTRAPIRPT